MDKKLLIVIVGVVIFALVSAPVMAASSPTAVPFDQIITILKDIQSNVNVLVANSAVKPTGYEYYAILMATSVSATRTNTWVINSGSSEAEVCVTNQGLSSEQPPEPDCRTVPRDKTELFVFNNPGINQYVKITTDSQSAVPYLEWTLAGSLLEKYSPNDFYKLEIYS